MGLGDKLVIQYSYRQFPADFSGFLLIENTKSCLESPGKSPMWTFRREMIYVTRLNHTSVVLNCDLIEHIETTPDTIISLTTGQKLMVLESAEEIIARVTQYRRSIQAPEQLEARSRPDNGRAGKF
jgi:flagellar protein FlbD